MYSMEKALSPCKKKEEKDSGCEIYSKIEWKKALLNYSTNNIFLKTSKWTQNHSKNYSLG